MKRIDKIWLSMVFAICASAAANDWSNLAISSSEGIDLPKYSKASLKDPEFEAKAAFIFSVLYYTSEINIHQMNGASGNQVFINEEGSEAVFDKEGNLVTDCENMGSYNYADGQKQPLTHFSIDILPWLRWGNCREDTTTIAQRIDAYVLDFELGLIVASSDKRGYFLPQDIDPSDPLLSVTLAFFIQAVESSGLDLYSFIMSADHSKGYRLEFIEALKTGMSDLLLKA
jgi:hypothetical protein